MSTELLCRAFHIYALSSTALETWSAPPTYDFFSLRLSCIYPELIFALTDLCSASLCQAPSHSQKSRASLPSSILPSQSKPSSMATFAPLTLNNTHYLPDLQTHENRQGICNRPVLSQENGSLMGPVCRGV